MKVKILFVLLTISLAINAVIFYGLTKYDLVEKGSTQLPKTSMAADPLKLIENKVDIEEKVKSGYGYIYSLTDDQIMKAINEGKKMVHILVKTSNYPYYHRPATIVHLNTGTYLLIHLTDLWQYIQVINTQNMIGRHL